MRFASLPLSAIALYAAMSGPAAHAQQLATWSFRGVIGNVHSGSRWADIQFAEDQQAAVDLAMAPFAAGQAFTLNVLVDLDTPYGPDGVASFPNAIKRQELLIPQAGVAAINESMVHQGVSITPIDYETKSGDVYYFYLPAGYDYLSPSARPVNSYGGTVYFIDPEGLINQSPDLHAFAAAFDPAKYTYMLGGTPVNNPACGGQCGTLDFTIESATLTMAAVPEPGTWLTMALGLAGIAGATQRRLNGHKVA
jgi:PEP-CTERM motif